jgi:hypothetical protein
MHDPCEESGVAAGRGSQAFNGWALHLVKCAFRPSAFSFKCTSLLRLLDRSGVDEGRPRELRGAASFCQAPGVMHDYCERHGLAAQQGPAGFNGCLVVACSQVRILSLRIQLQIHKSVEVLDTFGVVGGPPQRSTKALLHPVRPLASCIFTRCTPRISCKSRPCLIPADDRIWSSSHLIFTMCTPRPSCGSCLRLIHAWFVHLVKFPSDSPKAYDILCLSRQGRGTDVRRNGKPQSG